MKFGTRKLIIVAVGFLGVLLLLVGINSLKTFWILLGAILSAITGVISTYLGCKIREQEWRKENVYKPLYNEVKRMVVSNGAILSEEFTPKWEGIDSYSKLRIEESLCTALDTYSEKIRSFKEVLVRYKSGLEALVPQLLDVTVKALKPYLDIETVSSGKRAIVLEKRESGMTYITVETLVRKFYDAFTLSNTGEDPYENLVKYSKARNWGNKRHFDEWHSKHPEMFNQLASELTRIDLPKKHKKITKELKKRKRDILTKAENLKRKLEKRIPRIW